MTTSAKNHKPALTVALPLAQPWDRFRGHWQACQKCPSKIGQYAHAHVFARGALPCQVLFLGEAPGDTEDMTGYPFVGEAGKVLDVMIERVYRQVQTRPFSVAITNMVLCRPCDSPTAPFRQPTTAEKQACAPRLETFIREFAKPKLIVCLGNHAAGAIAALERGEGEVGGVPACHVRHPGFILRHGGDSNPVGRELICLSVDRIISRIRELGIF